MHKQTPISAGFASQPSHTAQINEPETFDSEKRLVFVHLLKPNLFGLCL